MRKGNRVAKAAIEFEDSDGLLKGFHLVGFTICDDADKGLFVLFPASMMSTRVNKGNETQNKTFFFLRPQREEQIQELEDAILDVYDSMVGFKPQVKE